MLYPSLRACMSDFARTRPACESYRYDNVDGLIWHTDCYDSPSARFHCTAGIATGSGQTGIININPGDYTDCSPSARLQRIKDHDCHLSEDDGCSTCEEAYSHEYPLGGSLEPYDINRDNELTQ